MRSFKDQAGKEWKISIDTGAVRMLRRELNVDLVDVPAFSELVGKDPVRLVEVLFQLCQDQASEAGISPDQFAKGFAGDALERGGEALMNELVDFFPSAQRGTLRKVKETGRKLQTEILKTIDAKLDAIDPAEMVKNLLSTSGESSTSSPALPA